MTSPSNLISKEIGREITRTEALGILRRSEEAGLVHMVDNAREGIKHTCNCCGCCCWVPSEQSGGRGSPGMFLMATYFSGKRTRRSAPVRSVCGHLPVQVIKMEGDFPVVDLEWCIGCGVCAVHALHRQFVSFASPMHPSERLQRTPPTDSERKRQGGGKVSH